MCLPEQLATTLYSVTSSTASAGLSCEIATSADDCARIGAAAAQEYGLDEDVGQHSVVCEWIASSSNDGIRGHECRPVTALQYLIARKWCTDSIEGVATACGENTGGVCTMVDCPADSDSLYTGRECVLEPSIAFASWCAGRSREESLCTEPTEAATTGGCISERDDTQSSAYGRGVPVCRWAEADESDAVAGPRCSSNLERWLAASGRRH